MHFGLADLTGFLPRMVGLKEGYLGFADDYNDDIMWSLLKRLHIMHHKQIHVMLAVQIP